MSRDSIQDAADRYFAATAAAGQAVLAVRSGLGVAGAGIEPAETEDENPYRGFCVPRRFRGAASTLRFLVSGEAAQVALGLKSFSDVCLLSTHLQAANVVRAWEGYWRTYQPSLKHSDDISIDEEDEEAKALIWLARWQVLRKLRCEPERSAIESLALEIRNGKTFSGVAVEQFVRGHCRSRNRKVGFQIPVSES